MCKCRRAEQRRLIVAQKPRRARLTLGRRWSSLLLVTMIPCFLTIAAHAQDNAKATGRVIVLQPLIRFEVLPGKAISRPRHASSGEDFEERLLLTAAETLTSRKFITVTPEALQNTPVDDELKRLQPQASRLARGIVNEEAKPILSELATLTENSAVLVQSLTVKAGPSGSWDSFSGQIRSAMSSTVFQVSLISCQTGQVLWKNESVARKIYRSDDKDFTKWLGTVYQTLQRQSN